MLEGGGMDSCIAEATVLSRSHCWVFFFPVVDVVNYKFAYP